MKRLLVIVLLMVCWVAVAYAAMQNSKQKAGVKNEKKEIKKKKNCSYTCLFS
jgi:hypothetical protein